MEEKKKKILSDRRLVQIQAFSGLILFLFVAVHLLNTVFAIHSKDAYNLFQRKARTVYQFPPVEIFFIVLPIFAHISAGLLRLKRRNFRLPKQNWRTRLHYLSGYFLLLVIFGHIIAVRGPSIIFKVYPEFEGLSFSLWWLPWIFYPYYILFSITALYHTLHGLFLASAIFGIKLPLHHGKLFWTLVAIGSVFLIWGILGLGGRLYEIPDPRESSYGKLYEKYLNVDLSRE